MPRMRNKLYLLCIVCCLCFVVKANDSRFQLLSQSYSDSAVVFIPFEYKQSALFHVFTYEVIDSVVNLLLKNDKITLTIKGFAQADEGTDSVCKWLSEDRAFFVKKYILGRGVQEERIAYTEGMGAKKSTHSIIDKNNRTQYFRAELVLTFPPPPPTIIADRDEDGILNEADTCPDNFGYADNKGCPDSNAIIVPFEPTHAYLSAFTYRVMDSVVALLLNNTTYKLRIEGHAFEKEGTADVCEWLAINRAALVKKYLLSRFVPAKNILTVNSYGVRRPLNAAKNPAEEVANSRVQIFIQQ